MCLEQKKKQTNELRSKFFFYSRAYVYTARVERGGLLESEDWSKLPVLGRSGTG